MNSLCSNVIKAKDVKIKGKKIIKNFSDVSQDEDKFEEINVELQMQLEEELAKAREEARIKIEEAENKYQEMIQAAQEESEKIIQEAKEQSGDIEKKAYEEGHSQGLKNGYEDGYKEAYEEHVEKAKEEAKQIVDNATNIMIDAKNQVESYIKDNKHKIIELSVSIAEQVLREKFEDVSSMDNLLLNVIEEYSLKENFVIKVNPMYKESLDNQILNLKENHKINADVFVLGDESIDSGNAVIDNTKGRLVVGIDGVLDKIKEELL